MTQLTPPNHSPNLNKNSSNSFPLRNFLPVFWLSIVVVLLVSTAFIFNRGLQIETNLLSLLPSFKEEIFFNSVKKLKEYFEIIHIHGNNHFPKSDTGLPMIIEMTLLNKKYAPKKIEYINNFPIKDLDYPNQPFAEDLFFSFQN